MLLTVGPMPTLPTVTDIVVLASPTTTDPRVTAVGVSALLLSGCSAGGATEGDAKTLTLWHFESETSAMGIA